MAISTATTTLQYSTDDITYNKLVDIINYPDMGSTPARLDTTDLSAEKYKTSILGLQELPDLTFEANYDETAFDTIDALAGQKLYFKLQFGTAGADGEFTWEGEVSIYAMGAGVDEVRRMSITLSAQTEIVFSTTA